MVGPPLAPSGPFTGCRSLCARRLPPLCTTHTHAALARIQRREEDASSADALLYLFGVGFSGNGGSVGPLLRSLADLEARAAAEPAANFTNEHKALLGPIAANAGQLSAAHVVYAGGVVKRALEYFRGAFGCAPAPQAVGDPTAPSLHAPEDIACLTGGDGAGHYDRDGVSFFLRTYKPPAHL